MLADELAAALDQLLSAFLLGGGIVPGTGEGDFHGGGGAHGPDAQEEGGVTGDNLGVGEGADVTDLGFLSGELAGLDHLVQLQAGHHARQVTALIDSREGVVVVGQVLGVGLGAGGVAELHVGELLGGLDHVVLMAEAVGEDGDAAGAGHIGSGLVAAVVLVDAGLQNHLDAQLLAGSLGGVDEVQVVGGLLVMQADEAYLDLLCGLLGGLGALAANDGKDHHQTHHDCQKAFHSDTSSCL